MTGYDVAKSRWLVEIEFDGETRVIAVKEANLIFASKVLDPPTWRPGVNSLSGTHSAPYPSDFMARSAVEAIYIKTQKRRTSLVKVVGGAGCDRVEKQTN